MKGIPTLYNHPCIVMKLFQVLRQPFKSLISPAGLCKYDTHVTKKIVRRKNTGKKTSYFNCLSPSALIITLKPFEPLQSVIKNINKLVYTYLIHQISQL